MLVKVHGSAVQGIEAAGHRRGERGAGFAAFHIVGLGDKAG